MTRPRRNLRGQRFGRWTAEEYAGGGRWKCRCDCGTSKDVVTTSLMRGLSLSCGCRSSEVTRARNLSANPCVRKPIDDLTGQRFGRWTVVEYQKNSRYSCRCDCGANAVVKRSHLLSGASTSCGCYRYEESCRRGEALRVPEEVKREKARLRTARYCATEKFRRTRAAYEASEEGSANRARWSQSEKYRRAVQRRRESGLARESCRKFDTSPHGRKKRAEYARSAAARASWRRYMNSPKGRATTARNNNRRRMLLLALPATLSATEWLRICEAWGFRCAYCGNGNVKLSRDHVWPLAAGGSDEVENVVPACRSCNSRKSDFSLAETFERLKLDGDEFWQRREAAFARMMEAA